MINILHIAHFAPLFSVVKTKTSDVPTHLDAIYHTESWILGGMLFVSFLLLALAKRLEPNILDISLKSFFTLGTPDGLQKFEVRFTSSGFVLLGFNFLISLWVCFTLFAQHVGSLQNYKWVIYGMELNSWQLTFGTLLLIIALLVYNFIGLFITSFLTGEYTTMRVFISQTWLNLLFFGLLFFALGVIWLLNSSGAPYFFQTFNYLILSYFAIRILKTLLAALFQGVSWYYIILYLCTLEILPILVIYHYVIGF